MSSMPHSRHEHERNAGGKQFVLVLNCGSSSIKCALFDAVRVPQERSPRWKGQVAVSDDSWGAALREVRREIEAQRKGVALTAVSHRIVHGGGRYDAPTIIDTDVLAKLHSYASLAPLHQPFALQAIDAARRSAGAAAGRVLRHRVPPHAAARWSRCCRCRMRCGSAACGVMAFTACRTSTWRSRSPSATAMPRAAARSSRTSAAAPASARCTALQSVATTMGFSALDGLMMGTRCGSLDPGVLLHLMQSEKLDVRAARAACFTTSPGCSASPACRRARSALLEVEDTNPRARAALELYVRRIVREIGALTAVLGGLDMLAFTAGVGEHSAVLRERICGALGWLGVQLDDEANRAHAPTISDAGSRVAVAVEPTNEEWIAARAAIRLLGKASRRYRPP